MSCSSCETFQNQEIFIILEKLSNIPKCYIAIQQKEKENHLGMRLRLGGGEHFSGSNVIIQGGVI